MKTCPFCNQQIPVEARECKFCHRAVVRGCPFCAEEISVIATVCRWCSSDVAPGRPSPPPLARPTLAPGPVGEERSVVLWLLLTFVTCGISAYVWFYQMACDLNRHGGRQRLNPGVDILLIFCTCGFWFIYICYKYPRTLMDIVEEEGGRTTSDLAVLCLVVGIFVPLASLAILQNELNGHWKQHLPR